ncbi:hypothetical protein CTM53_10265 [Prevotella intermedia]|uniref:Uncharacterized protein n=1 Tax=Prevotella intermedia TaxID=28131 RepID=A0AAJ3VCU8_PREIN|nr:hypothetical protein CTM53_10265 [Prevotella intermedia]
MQPTFVEEAADKRVGLMRQKGSEYQRVATHWEVGSDGKGRWLRGGGVFSAFQWLYGACILVGSASNIAVRLAFVLYRFLLSKA